MQFPVTVAAVVTAKDGSSTSTLAGPVGGLGVSEGGPVTGKILLVICSNMQFLT